MGATDNKTPVVYPLWLEKSKPKTGSSQQPGTQPPEPAIKVKAYKSDEVIPENFYKPISTIL